MQFSYELCNLRSVTHPHPVRMSRSSIGKQVRIGDFPLSNELTVTLSGPERDHYTLSVAAYISTEHATLCLLPHAAALRPKRGSRAALLHLQHTCTAQFCLQVSKHVSSAASLKRAPASMPHFPSCALLFWVTGRSRAPLLIPVPIPGAASSAAR